MGRWLIDMYMYMNSERLGAHNHTIGQLELIIYNSFRVCLLFTVFKL